METAHSVPVTLDGTPFVLEFARQNGIVRITLDARLLQQFWIEPGEGELAICVERNHLPRTTAPPDVQAELRLYDWHVTGTSKGSSEARRRWNKLVGNKLFMKRVGNAYAYVEDDPALPNVLIIGDSISIYYTDPVRRLLAGRADVFRTPMGPGKAETLFASVDELLTQHHWDVIHFNTGLHDFARKQGTAEDLEQYRANLEKIVAKLQATGARLIWASTTPVPEQVPQGASSDELARKYNAVAKQIMDARQIPIDDLYSAMKPVHDRYWLKPNNIHFNEAGSAFLGRIVTNAILQELDRRPDP
jgi:acyl-CoA thioesterase-1